MLSWLFLFRLGNMWGYESTIALHFIILIIILFFMIKLRHYPLICLSNSWIFIETLFQTLSRHSFHLKGSTVWVYFRYVSVRHFFTLIRLLRAHCLIVSFPWAGCCLWTVWILKDLVRLVIVRQLRTWSLIDRSDVIELQLPTLVKKLLLRRYRLDSGRTMHRYPLRLNFDGHSRICRLQMRERCRLSWLTQAKSRKLSNPFRCHINVVIMARSAEYFSSRYFT